MKDETIAKLSTWLQSSELDRSVRVRLQRGVFTVHLREYQPTHGTTKTVLAGYSRDLDEAFRDALSQTYQ